MVNLTVTTDEATFNVIIDALQDRVESMQSLRKFATTPSHMIWYDSKIKSLTKAIKDMQDFAVKV
jgi:hypothetical protein